MFFKEFALSKPESIRIYILNYIKQNSIGDEPVYKYYDMNAHWLSKQNL